MKLSSRPLNRLLLSQLKEVKQPPNLSKLFSNQSKLFFQSLVIKHWQLDKVRKDMLNYIKAEKGATTTFIELNTFIQGLHTLISTNAETFGVTPEDIKSHQNTAKIIMATSPATPNDLPHPKNTTSGDTVTTHYIVNGLLPLTFYNIQDVYKLMNWSQALKSKIDPMSLKEGSIMFQVPNNAVSNMDNVVTNCNTWGWDSSYKKDSSYKGDWVAFVWRELIDISSCEEEEDENIDTKGGDGGDRLLVVA